MLFSWRKNTNKKPTIRHSHSNDDAELVDKSFKKKDEEKTAKICAISVTSLSDIRNIIEILKGGASIIASLRKVNRENTEKAKELLERIVNYVRSINGNIIGIGEDYLLITPHNIIIEKIQKSVERASGAK